MGERGVEIDLTWSASFLRLTPKTYRAGEVVRILEDLVELGEITKENVSVGLENRKRCEEDKSVGIVICPKNLIEMLTSALSRHTYSLMKRCWFRSSPPKAG